MWDGPRFEALAGEANILLVNLLNELIANSRSMSRISLKGANCWVQESPTFVSFWLQTYKEDQDQFLAQEITKQMLFSGARYSQNCSVYFLAPKIAKIITTVIQFMSSCQFLEAV